VRPEAGQLFKDAEVRAERIVAVLRVVVALALGAVFLLQAGPRLADIEGAFARHLVIAMSQLIVYLGFGLVSFRIAGSGAYRGWMSWAFATLDLVFIGLYLWFGLGYTGIGANYIPALPVIWLAPCSCRCRWRARSARPTRCRPRCAPGSSARRPTSCAWPCCSWPGWC
jgi:adenylate cyclase